MKYLWSPTSVIVSRPDLPRGGSRAGQKRPRTGPAFDNLLLQTGCIEQQTECVRVTPKDVRRSVVVFGSIQKSDFRRFWDLFIIAHFYAIYLDFLVVI